MVKRIRNRRPAVQNSDAITAPLNPAPFTMFEIATYVGSTKTFSVMGKITLKTGLKMMTVARDEENT